MEIRATLRGKDGEVEDVTSAMAGAQDFFAAWKNNVEMPHNHSVGGWQCVDSDHPVEGGIAAYRVAYKTLKTVPFPAIQLNWPNLTIKMENGDIERGGITFIDTIQGRRADQHIIPENGRVVSREGSAAVYLSCPNATFNVAAWQETAKAVSYVEIIWASDADEPDIPSLLEARRNAVSPLLAMLEFEFGPRLLSTRLLEELGRVFPDGHWNRQLYTGAVYAESQASFVHLDGRLAVERLAPLIERNQSLSRDERYRIRLASRWYWSVQAATDDVLIFTQWWLIIECLEMVRTTDIRPVRERLALLLGCTEAELRQPIGQLFGLRSKLLHGEDRSVAADSIQLAKEIACVLFAARIGVDISENKKRLVLLLRLAP